LTISIKKNYIIYQRTKVQHEGFKNDDKNISNTV